MQKRDPKICCEPPNSNMGQTLSYKGSKSLGSSSAPPREDGLDLLIGNRCCDDSLDKELVLDEVLDLEKMGYVMSKCKFNNSKGLDGA